MCNNVITVIDSFLLKRAEDGEAKVFYQKMKGDYNRYIAEYAQGESKQNVANNALVSYKEATEAAKTLSTIHPISLGLALNFSVFYYEVMNDHVQACIIAKNSLDAANKELPQNVDEFDEQYPTVQKNYPSENQKYNDQHFRNILLIKIID